MVTFDELIQVDFTMHTLTARIFNNSLLFSGDLKQPKALFIWLSLLFSVFFCATSNAYTCDITIQNLSDKEALEQLRQLSSNSERPNIIVKQSRAYMIGTKAQCKELRATLQILDTVKPSLVFHLYQGPRPPRTSPNFSQRNKSQKSKTLSTRNTLHISTLKLKLGEETKVELETTSSPQQTHYLSRQAPIASSRNDGDIILNRPKLKQHAKSPIYSGPNTIIDSQVGLHYQLLLLPLPSNIAGTARLRLATELSSTTETNGGKDYDGGNSHLTLNGTDMARRWPTAKAELTLKPGQWYQLGEVLLPLDQAVEASSKGTANTQLKTSTKVSTSLRRPKVLLRTFISFQGPLPE